MKFFQAEENVNLEFQTTKSMKGQPWLCMPLIPATWEREVEGCQSWQYYLWEKQTKSKWTENMVQVVEHLSSKYKALSSNHNIMQISKDKKKEPPY
jgi:hypothetical protein